MNKSISHSNKINSKVRMTKFTFLFSGSSVGTLKLKCVLLGVILCLVIS